MNEIAQKHGLLELSLADAIRLINTDDRIDPSRRTHWLCSIRKIASWLDRPLENLPARLTALRQPIARLSAARLNVTQKTLSNHKSNIRASLNHLSNQGMTLPRGTPLSPVLDNLIQQIDDRWARTRLLSFSRYISARRLRPDEVDDRILRDFFTHRTETTFLRVTLAFRREVARAWNSCIDNVPGFPSTYLTVELIKPNTCGPEWEAFSPSFRDEIENYLDTLKVVHRSASGRRRNGCKPSTINTRRREIMAASRQAIRTGISIDSLTSLRDLLIPDTVSKLLDAYWQQNGERPKAYVIDLAWKLFAIARETGCLSDQELEQIDDLRFALEQHRKHGLTEKNLAVVRAVLSGKIWTRVRQLPDRLMSGAEKLRSTSPTKAAVRAQLAVAIRILTFAPVRIGNLAGALLNINLIRPGGINEPYWLVYPDYDVKNGIDLTFVLDEQTSSFIDRYIRDFRPVLLHGTNQSWLFPGGKGNGHHKNASTLSDQITRCIEKELGFRITAHQFRHAAAAVILKAQPGNYELVRRVLGHRNIKTTVNSYVGLETMASSQQFANMILDLSGNDSKRIRQ